MRLKKIKKVIWATGVEEPECQGEEHARNMPGPRWWRNTVSVGDP